MTKHHTILSACRISALLKQCLFSIGLCLCFSLAGYSQSAASDSSVTKNQALSYVKIEVGMHILDCPVLPPQLKAKLMTIKGIQDYTVNLKDETILFAVPEGVITKEQVVALAVRSGFPVSAVNVIMDNKPFTN